MSETRIAMYLDPAVRRVLVREHSIAWALPFAAYELVGVWDVTPDDVLPLLRNVLWIFLADGYETLIDLNDSDNQQQADAEFGAFYIWSKQPDAKVRLQGKSDLLHGLLHREREQREAWEEAERKRRNDPAERTRRQARRQRELENWDADRARVRKAVLGAVTGLRGSA